MYKSGKDTPDVIVNLNNSPTFAVGGNNIPDEIPPPTAAFDPTYVLNVCQAPLTQIYAIDPTITVLPEQLLASPTDGNETNTSNPEGELEVIKLDNVFHAPDKYIQIFAFAVSQNVVPSAATGGRTKPIDTAWSPLNLTHLESDPAALAILESAGNPVPFPAG